MEIINIGIIVVIGIWILKRYRIRQKQKKRDEEMEQIMERLEKNRMVCNVIRRNKLIESRDAHLSSIRRKNGLYLQNEGVLWTDEAKEMKEYDKHYYNDWKAEGMIPPSFTKDGQIGYVNPQKVMEENKIWVQSESERIEKMDAEIQRIMKS